MLSKADIQKFREIYKEYYGKEIGEEDAHRESSSLLRMLEVITETLSKNEASKKNREPLGFRCENSEGEVYSKNDV